MSLLGRSPAVVVVALMALAAIGAAAVGVADGSDGDGSDPIVARSGPSPGSSVVVRSDPEPAPGDASGAGATDGTGTEEGAVPSPFAELRDRPTTVFATDFTSLGDDWEIYDSPGHAGLGWRRPSAITLEPEPAAEGGSVLTITARMGTDNEEAGEIVSGGMALLRPRTYGTYTFRMRVDPDPAEVTSGVAILWPWSNRWPEDGELDMFETWVNRSTRAPVETNIHYLDPFAEAPYDTSDDRLFSIVHSGLDGSEWHTYRFEWRADQLTMAIDDGPVRLLSDDPLHIPDWMMVPTFQLDAFPAPGGTREDAALDGPVVLEVDWLVVEE
ncbi:MAG: glycoside hydrolase family 16 protein [Actinomycetota bacterium]